MKRNQHEIDRYLELTYALGIRKQNVNKKTLFYLRKKDSKFTDRFFKKAGIDRKRSKIISVQIGTSPTMRWKQWSPNKYRQLCDLILETPNTVVILQGSPSEKSLMEKIAHKMKHRPIIAAGKTTIKQVAALIKKSNLLVCNDSGLMHVAVAVDTPVVAIYGPTDYTRTAPLGNKHTIIRKKLNCSPCFKMGKQSWDKVTNCPYNYKCLKSISVNEVYKIIKKNEK